MNRKDIRLAALDLDGTLLHEDKTISDYTLSVIEKLTRQKILVVPSTGRNLEGLRKNILQVKDIAYAICSNGAQVFSLSDCKPIYEASIPLENAVAALQYLENFPVWFYVFTDKGTWRSSNWRGTWIKERFPFIPMEENNVENLPEFLLKNQYTVLKIGAFVLDDAVFRRILDTGIPIPEISLFRTGSCNMELNHIHASKAQGLKALCCHLGISTSQVLAVGDNQNDIAMLQMAGVSVAMGNSEEDVKSAADFVAKTNEEDGAAVFLEQYFGLS